MQFNRSGYPALFTFNCTVYISYVVICLILLERVTKILFIQFPLIINKLSQTVMTI